MAVLTGVHPRPWWKCLNANKKQQKTVQRSFLICVCAHLQFHIYLDFYYPYVSTYELIRSCIYLFINLFISLVSASFIFISLFVFNDII